MRSLPILLFVVVGVAPAQERNATLYVLDEVATADHVRVFKSATGPLVRTTSLNVTGCKLLPDDAVQLTMDPTLHPTVSARLEAALGQQKSAGNVSADKLVVVTPTHVTLTLSLRNKVVGEKVFKGDGPLDIVTDKTFHWRIDLKKGVSLTAEQLQSCELSLVAMYDSVVDARASYAAVSVFRERVTKVFESMGGGARGQITAEGGTFVERRGFLGATERAVEVIVREGINADPKTLETLGRGQAERLKEVNSVPPPEQRHTLYTVQMGRLDVGPATKDHTTYESRLTTAAEDSFRSMFRTLHKAAREAGTWERFRESFHRSTSNSGDVWASIGRMIDGGLGGEHSTDKSGETTTEKATWTKVQQYFLDEGNLETFSKRGAEQVFKGNANVKGGESKGIELVAVKDITVALEMTDAAIDYRSVGKLRPLTVPELGVPVASLLPHDEAYDQIKSRFGVSVVGLDRERKETTDRGKEVARALQFPRLSDESADPFRAFSPAREGIIELRIRDTRADPFGEYPAVPLNSTPLRKFDPRQLASSDWRGISTQGTDRTTTDGVIDLVTKHPAMRKGLSTLDFTNIEATRAKFVAMFAEAKTTLPAVERLTVANVQPEGNKQAGVLTDIDLASIAQLPKLKVLLLGRESGLSSEGFKHLVAAVGLTEMWVCNPADVDRGLCDQATLEAILAACPRLVFNLKITRTSPATAEAEARLIRVVNKVAEKYPAQVNVHISRDR